jgi:signal transduction histidine kinase
MHWRLVQRDRPADGTVDVRAAARAPGDQARHLWTPIAKLLLPADSELDGLLGSVLTPLRWVTLVGLFVLTYARPLPVYAGIRTWILILGFVSYNLLIDLLRRRWAWLRHFAHVPILDLPMVAIICALSPTATGPIFALFLLAITCAAATLTLRASLSYTAIAVALMGALAPTLPLWLGSPEEIRELGAQLIVLAVVGVGTAILMHRLVLERTLSHASRAEAARLGELDRLRAEFIASISHDLRTPLTAAGAGLGMLETSAADRLRIDEQQLLGNIRRNIARLSSLIDDLLAYNQLQAGALHLDRVPVDLRTVVADALPAVQPLIRTKGQILQVDLPLPLPHVGDTRRLGQVLINLLCNAHQHTPPGTHITITGHIDNGQICLVVCDDGPGIPESEREAIFERFYRLSAAGSGSGLGLAIARGLVELHSGRIWVEQTNERGSMFCIALPCAPSKEEP